MLELVYKLNLPPVTSVLKEDSTVLDSKKRYCIYKSLEVIKPEWTFWNDIHFDNAVSFYRDLVDIDISKIHTDQQTPEAMPWAVNWIHGGSGILEFWLPEQTDSFTWKFQNSDNNSGTRVPEITTSQAPYKTYAQSPGAYLINTTFPHRANGWNSRLAVSIRSTSSFSIPWEDVVKKFEKYITCY